LIRLALTPLDAARDQYGSLAAAVSEDRLARANRYLRADDQLRSVLSECLLRRILQEVAGTSWWGVQIAPQGVGRPNLISPTGWWFSTSHSGNWVGVAIGCMPIGIDLERSSAGILDVDAAYFRELDPHSDDVDARTRLWTMKEAAFKCIGLSSLDEICGIEVDLQDDPPTARHFGQAYTLWTSLQLGNHVLTVAWPASFGRPMSPETTIYPVSSLIVASEERSFLGA
jgi:4'-phosphopantetheinyl transferase